MCFRVVPSKNLQRYFSALSNPLRAKAYMFILNTAGNCEVDVGKGIGGNCVSRLCRELNIPQPSASHYVKGLIDAGLIIQVRSGRRRFLFPDPSAADELQNFTQFVSEKVIPVPHSD